MDQGIKSRIGCGTWPAVVLGGFFDEHFAGGRALQYGDCFGKGVIRGALVGFAVGQAKPHFEGVGAFGGRDPRLAMLQVGEVHRPTVVLRVNRTAIDLVVEIERLQGLSSQ